MYADQSQRPGSTALVASDASSIRIQSMVRLGTGLLQRWWCQIVLVVTQSKLHMKGQRRWRFLAATVVAHRHVYLGAIGASRSEENNSREQALFK